ncbi:energy transducer TonB [Endozoicomonas gorgoniicola]|uniref:Protein TonB n=1 Tax=Endozoicomonas gorgoniicola TaxID=1234144 RepID=A0ABT3N3R7_9GAMM|nr:energy transducer TonB [Endozoicomonas gorgoniicola]MCW7556277.1 energy transducer TonB [Endozoicomonas gorgoniicola]
MWPLLHKPRTSFSGLILLAALLVNLLLVSLIYTLTMSSDITQMKRPTLAQVYFSTDRPEPSEEKLPETLLSSAPTTASSPPPPPLTLSLSTALDASVSIPDLTVPDLDINTSINSPVFAFNAFDNNPGSSMSSKISMAQVVFQMPPTYPMAAKQKGIEGHVTLDLAINPDGRVEGLKVVEESPPGIFYRSASRAVRRWRFVSPEATEWQRIVIRYELEK